MKDYLDFKGKTAIVTGGRRGIGRAIALAFAECGARVAVLARSSSGDDILQELADAGTPGVYLSCDVGSREARCGMIKKAVALLGGRLDILVNNAGLQFEDTIESCTLENWETSEAVLLEAPFDFSQQAIPFMKTTGHGKIINISSICALREGGCNFSYGVMKSALAGMTRCMANSLAQEGIHVNAIAPGIVHTDLTEACFSEENHRQFIARYPARRLGLPEEIAGCALFLASEMSSFVHGHMLVADGGFCGN